MDLSKTGHKSQAGYLKRKTMGQRLYMNNFKYTMFFHTSNFYLVKAQCQVSPSSRPNTFRFGRKRGEHAWDPHPLLLHLCTFTINFFFQGTKSHFGGLSSQSLFNSSTSNLGCYCFYSFTVFMF